MASKTESLTGLEAKASAIAEQMGYELVDVCMDKEPTGKYLRFYIDKEEGVSLDDCEAFHKAVRNPADSVDYDFMEVSSPGIDRPLKRTGILNGISAVRSRLSSLSRSTGRRLLPESWPDLKKGTS